MEHRLSTTLLKFSITMSQIPWPLTNTAACMCGLLYLTWSPTLINFLFEASSYECVIALNTVLSAIIHLVALIVELLAAGFEHQVTILRSVRNMSLIHQAINDVPHSTRTQESLQSQIWCVCKDLQWAWTTAHWFLSPSHGPSSFVVATITSTWQTPSMRVVRSLW